MKVVQIGNASMKILLIYVLGCLLVFGCSNINSSNNDYSSKQRIIDTVVYSWIEPSWNDSQIVKNVLGCNIFSMSINKDSIQVSYNLTYTKYQRLSWLNSTNNTSDSCDPNFKSKDTVQINYGAYKLTSILPYSKDSIDTNEIRSELSNLTITKCSSFLLKSRSSYILSFSGLPKGIEVKYYSTNICHMSSFDSVVGIPASNDTSNILGINNNYMGCIVDHRYPAQCGPSYNSPPYTDVTVPIELGLRQYIVNVYNVDSSIYGHNISWELLMTDSYNRTDSISMKSVLTKP